MGLYDFTIYDIIARNAESLPQKICWYEVDTDRELTFKEYREQVDQLAAGLSRAGLQHGDRIGVVGKNSIEFFLLYGAAARLGAILLPVNWRLSTDEMIFNLNDCTPALIFLDQEFQQPLADRRNELPSVSGWYNLKGDLGQLRGFTTLMKGVSDLPEVASTSGDGYVIIHTAAVAGRPRGALLRHANLINANLVFHSCMGIDHHDIHFNLLPLFHVAGLFMAMATFHAGGTNINISKFKADQAVELIDRKQITLLFDFPPILDSIVGAAAEATTTLSSLRAAIGLGTPEVITRFQEMSGGTYHVMYGQTETSCLATLGTYNEKPGSAGRVVPLARVQLVNEYDRPVPQGMVGEICVRGPMVFAGYWNLPEDNNYTFRDGWHHTGDLGRFDEDGYLFYAGRKAEKELIKPGGENVYPAEVEKVILQHPAVAQVAVIGVPDPKWKEGIKAVCQLHPGQELAKEELIKFVGSRIASFKKPQYVTFVDELPSKEDGSIDRDKVKSLHGQA